MNLLNLLAYGTPEGVKKEWDTRGRKGPPTDNAIPEAANRIVLKKYGFQKVSKNHYVGKQEGVPGQFHVEYSPLGMWRHYKGDRPNVTIGRGDSAGSLDDHLAERGFKAGINASETYYGPNTDMGPAKGLDPE